MWRFQNEVDTRADGSVVQILPADGWDGYAIYTTDGFVSINIMPKGRKWKVKTATLKELKLYRSRTAAPTSAVTKSTPPRAP